MYFFNLQIKINMHLIHLIIHIWQTHFQDSHLKSINWFDMVFSILQKWDIQYCYKRKHLLFKVLKSLVFKYIKYISNCILQLFS